MQIETIETARDMLANWGEWARRHRLGTEFPSEQPFVRLMRQKGDMVEEAGRVPVDEVQALRVDGMLGRLRLRDNELHGLLWDFYLVQHTYRELARRNGCSTQKVVELLRSGEAWIDACLFMSPAA